LSSGGYFESLFLTDKIIRSKHTADAQDRLRTLKSRLTEEKEQLRCQGVTLLSLEKWPVNDNELRVGVQSRISRARETAVAREEACQVRLI
jgi:hypothetical protein